MASVYYQNKGIGLETNDNEIDIYYSGQISEQFRDYLYKNFKVLTDTDLFNTDYGNSISYRYDWNINPKGFFRF